MRRNYCFFILDMVYEKAWKHYSLIGGLAMRERKSEMNVSQAWDRINDIFATVVMKALRTESQDKNVQQRVRYSLLVLLGEIEKFLLLMAFFKMCHWLVEFLISYVALVSVRMFCGGSHRKTTLGCYLQSLSVFVTVMLLEKSMIMMPGCSVLICFGIVIVIWFFSPLPSPRQVTCTSIQEYQFRGKALIAIFVIQTLCVHLPERYNNVVMWTWLVLIAEMTVMYMKNKKGDSNHDRERSIAEH